LTQTVGIRIARFDVICEEFVYPGGKWRQDVVELPVPNAVSPVAQAFYAVGSFTKRILTSTAGGSLSRSTPINADEPNCWVDSPARRALTTVEFEAGWHAKRCVHSWGRNLGLSSDGS
jgi:hypothetical protein